MNAALKSQNAKPYSNRQCAHEIIELIATEPVNNTTFLDRLAGSLRRLMARPDFQELGVKRQSNHTGDGSRWLYYDGETSIVVDYLPIGRKIPAHDHGVWEACCVYQGRLSHTTYLRRDDESKPGYADLEVVDDRILTAGDAVMLAPPTEIHSFHAIEENTYFLTVMGGPYKQFRNYFNPAEKTVAVRAPGGSR